MCVCVQQQQWCTGWVKGQSWQYLSQPAMLVSSARIGWAGVMGAWQPGKQRRLARHNHRARLPPDYPQRILNAAHRRPAAGGGHEAAGRCHLGCHAA